MARPLPTARDASSPVVAVQISCLSDHGRRGTGQPELQISRGTTINSGCRRYSDFKFQPVTAARPVPAAQREAGVRTPYH